MISYKRNDKKMSEKKCYIRRKNSQWEEGRSHHKIALNSYKTLYVDPLEPGMMPAGGFICADHEDGGLFAAHFSYVGRQVYQFLDQFGNIVQIMMAEPNIVAHINRITD